MDELQQILENSKITAETIKDSLFNSVLQTADYKPRDVFNEITAISDDFYNRKSIARMVGLAGLRGTGKTTLLWQSAQYIYKNYTQNIYFFHLGDLKKFDIGVGKIQQAFEKYLVNGRLNSYKKEIVLLFDEVHEDPNWARDLKVLYDLFPAAFVVATGSSALLLQSTADLVTRMFIQHVYPLSFTEFLSISLSDKKTNFEELKEILFHSENATELNDSLQLFKNKAEKYYSNFDNIQEHIIDYILYRNITRFIFMPNKSLINSSISDLISRIIHEDIPKLTKDINTQFSEKLLRRIASSDEINIQTLSQSIGISQKEINENLDILVKAELLNVLYPFGGIDTKINKTQKYFFMSPSVRRVILKPLTGNKNETDLLAKMLEDTVVLYLKRIFRDENIISFTSYKKGKNPDLIIETLPKPILLEVGINKNTTKQISKSRIKYKYGIVINSKIDKIELHNDVVIIPLKYFLLL